MDQERKTEDRDALLRDILDSSSRPNRNTAPAPRSVVSHAAEEAVPRQHVVSHAAAEPVTAELPSKQAVSRAAEAEAMEVQDWDAEETHAYAAPEPRKAVAHVNTYSAAETAHLYEDLDGISQSVSRETVAAPKKKQKRKKRKKGRVISALIITFLVLAVSIAISVMALTFGRDILGIHNDTKTRIVDIPTGSNTEDIAHILEDAGVINHPDLFVFFAGMSDKDGQFTAGEHEVRPDMAYETLFEELASPAMNAAGTVQIMFQEGITLQEAAEMLESTNVCDADEFLEFFNKKAIYGYTYESYLPSFVNEKFYTMEGYLFPDTYIFYEDMDVDLVCQKILENFDSKITPEFYERLEELDLSLDEMLTLASMIQAEAGTVEQMTKISSVFWNRLNNPTTFPKLQSDPTSNYVEEVIKPNIKEANPEMYAAYDTYQGEGLPPGAICNPGLDAIRAALYPATTEYYFFYANLDTRETYFSKTLQEHEAIQERVEGSRVTTPVNDESSAPVEVGVGTSVGTDENGDPIASEDTEDQEDEE